MNENGVVLYMFRSVILIVTVQQFYATFHMCLLAGVKFLCPRSHGVTIFTLDFWVAIVS